MVTRTSDDSRVGDCTPLPESLRQFVGSCQWVFAKTYVATWPHEYIVLDRVDEGLFVQLVHHIRTHGYEGRFYNKPITYFEEADIVYWTMGAPIEDTVIVNRCAKEQTYEYRLKHGTLPAPNRDEGRGGPKHFSGDRDARASGQK